MSGRLAENVAYFARVLRGAGMPVGPGAVIDAVGALEAAGLGRREDVYWTLHALFVRRREHSVLFDGAFRLFWRRRGLVEKLIAEMSPIAPADDRKEKPRPGDARVTEAMRPPRRADAPRTETVELTARLTTSDRDVLRSRDFAQMTADEVRQARQLVAALRLPDDTRPTRRPRPDPAGRQIDFRRSLGRSLRTGGATLDLAFRSRTVRPSPVVALVDISGSMSEYSRLFLHFLHAVSNQRRLHAFTFGTRLTNITRELAGRDPDEALARAASRAQDWEGGTRIAAALAEFNRLWSRRVLGQGAIVLLFTDGLERDVGTDLAFEVDRLHRSCRRLVWLNPLLRFDAFEPRAAGIRAMLPHVDEFRPIHSLRSMEQLVTALSGERRRSGPPSRLVRAA